jgi:hypothetical protein
MTKLLSKKNIHFHSLINNYGATNFQDTLAGFIVGLRDPDLRGTQFEHAIANMWFHFNTVHIYHKIKFTSYDPYIVGSPKELVVDAIHAQPTQKDRRNWDVPTRFDIAIINNGTGQETGVAGDLFSYAAYLSHHSISNNSLL